MGGAGARDGRGDRPPLRDPRRGDRRAGGVRPVEQGEGDSVVAAFARGGRCGARRARRAAPAASRAGWLPVRMAVHTGEAQLRDEGNYVGQAIIRCARLRSCGHGGQVLLSESTAALVRDDRAGRRRTDRAGHRRGCATCPGRSVSGSWSPRICAVTSRRCGRWTPTPHNLPVAATSFIGRDTGTRTPSPRLAAAQRGW